MGKGVKASGLALALAVMPLAAVAHPHIWVDTQIETVFGADGQISGVKITWSYDELYTLLVLEDHGWDPDADGVLTEAETAASQGFDMDWIEGYDGGMHLLLGEAPQALGAPEGATARLEEGRFITTHYRPLTAPLRPGTKVPLIIQNYDPEYYVAYTITAGTVSGDDACEAVVYGFDPDAADAALTAASQEYAASDDPNAPFPKIGAAYADEVRVACRPE